jgi:ABC-type uncharacterized transport system substrate-binding protein
MRRRKFLGVLSGAAVAWPIAARAQQPAMPVVGFLSGQSPETYALFPAAFRRGLSELGFVEGKNVAIEYRWANGHPDQLPVLAADLVHRQVNVIAATGTVASGLAAKAATASIPIVFNSGEDPVEAGFVSSLNRPGGNVTGISWFSVESVAKRLALLHELIPAARVIAFLANPKDPELAPQLSAAQAAAQAIDRQLIVVNATNPGEIDTAFGALLQQGARALIVASGPYFINQRAHLVALAAQHAIPCIYSDRSSPAGGGLMSYGNNLEDAYRRNGIYVARILKGDKPGDLPIDRSTKFELVVNLKTAQALGLTLSPSLLARADEVIE